MATMMSTTSDTNNHDDDERKEDDNNNQSTSGLHAPPHQNLAKVDFEVTLHDYKTGRVKLIPLTVLISWVYKGMPSNPANRWMDWNGFTVTDYQVQQRNS